MAKRTNSLLREVKKNSQLEVNDDRERRYLQADNSALKRKYAAAQEQIEHLSREVEALKQLGRRVKSKAWAVPARSRRKSQATAGIVLSDWHVQRGLTRRHATTSTNTIRT